MVKKVELLNPKTQIKSFAFIHLHIFPKILSINCKFLTISITNSKTQINHGRLYLNQSWRR
ncbi:hypothetical protein Hanom_Chr12g01152721 [Helianthus anomalus]